MLHLILQPSVSSALLQRIHRGDDIVFLENAVFRANKNDQLNTKLQKILTNKITIYILDVDLATRGINTNELVSGVKIITYPFLVDLTEKNKVIKTWN